MGRPSPLYILQPDPDPDWSWTIRYRLPTPRPRAEVLQIIHDGVQAPAHGPRKLTRVTHKGLNGAFVGLPGDDTAEIVHDVIFATDPSRRHGKRPAADSDQHALAIARTYGWREVDENGEELLTEEAIQAYGTRTMIRTIMGLNKDQYVGKSSFTLREVRERLPRLFTVSGGYLFSTQPGWETPYKEPAALVRLKEGYQYNSGVVHQLFELAWALNQQRRFVVETPKGALVYNLNLP